MRAELFALSLADRILMEERSASTWAVTTYTRCRRCLHNRNLETHPVSCISLPPLQQQDTHHNMRAISQQLGL